MDKKLKTKEVLNYLRPKMPVASNTAPEIDVEIETDKLVDELFNGPQSKKKPKPKTKPKKKKKESDEFIPGQESTSTTGDE